MKKKVVILTGLLSCLMMVFSIQTFGDSEGYEMGDKKGAMMPGHDCSGADCEQVPPEMRDECCKDYCDKHPGKCIVE